MTAPGAPADVKTGSRSHGERSNPMKSPKLQGFFHLKTQGVNFWNAGHQPPPTSTDQQQPAATGTNQHQHRMPRAKLTRPGHDEHLRGHLGCGLLLGVPTGASENRRVGMLSWGRPWRMVQGCAWLMLDYAKSMVS